MEFYTLAEKHDYDFSPEATARASAGYTSVYAEEDQSLTAAFNCAGTAGTFGTAGGCIGTFGAQCRFEWKLTSATMSATAVNA